MASAEHKPTSVLRDFLQGDGVDPREFLDAVADLGNLNLPLRMQWGFVYLEVDQVSDRDRAKLEKARDA